MTNNLYNPLISILIPTFNREKYIDSCVKSALNQTYKNIEIIIVDNASTDQTWQILNDLKKKDIRIKIFQNESNIGPVMNWKKCIDLSSGELVKILFSDDLLDKDFLKKSVHYFKDENIGFSFTSAKIFSANNSRLRYQIGPSKIYDSEKFIKGSILGKDYPLSPGCAIFRKQAIKKNLLSEIPNKLNIDYKSTGAGNDLLIFLLTCLDYQKFAFIDEPLSLFRSHNQSISDSSQKNQLYLSYLVAKSFFIETYFSTFIQTFNSHLILIRLKNKDLRKFLTYSNIYNDNKDFSLDYFYFIKKTVQKIKSLA